MHFTYTLKTIHCSYFDETPTSGYFKSSAEMLKTHLLPEASPPGPHQTPVLICFHNTQTLAKPLLANYFCFEREK